MSGGMFTIVNEKPCRGVSTDGNLALDVFRQQDGGS
jgi:hypothetical protein